MVVERLYFAIYLRMASDLRHFYVVKTRFADFNKNDQNIVK